MGKQPGVHFGAPGSPWGLWPLSRVRGRPFSAFCLQRVFITILSVQRWALVQQKAQQMCPFGDIFGYLSHKKRGHWACWLASRVFIFFHDFRDGKTFDPLQPAQSKHSLAFSASPSKPLIFHSIFGSILEIFGFELPSRIVVTKRP